MREININIEGYNVNGICVGCLNYNRKMFYDDDIKECFKMLGNIDVPDGLTAQVCWECLAAVKAVTRFQTQILTAYDVLINYSQEHTFLNSPKDLTQYSVTRLTTTCISISDTLTIEVEVKQETKEEETYTEEESKDAPNLNYEENIKEEADDHISDYPSQDQASSDEDVQLSQIKERKEKKDKKKKKKERSKKPNQNQSRKLKNLPEDIVELYTMSEEEMWSVRADDVSSAGFRRLRHACEHCVIGFNTLKLKECHDNGKHRPTGFCALRHRPDRRDGAQRSLPRPFHTKCDGAPSLLYVELYTMSEEEMWSVRADDVSSAGFRRLRHACEHCVIGFNTLKLKECHDNGKHRPKPGKSHQCDVCKAYFLTKDNLAVHRALHLTAYRCRQCGALTTMKRLMVEHACAKETASDEFPCTYCGKVFNSKSKLSYHRSTSCRAERPQCDCCGKVFANKMTLKYHLKLLPLKKDDKPKEKLYIPCKGCDKVFVSKKSYRAHVVIHEGHSYPCPICGKLFLWKRNLSRHTRAHRDRDAGATHQCRECNKTFASRDCYNNHMRLSKRHASESTYVHECSYCGKKFPTKWCMVDHIDWDHLKRVKYQCSYCYKAFKTAKIMVAHVNNIHGGRRMEPDGEHLCEVCGKSYKSVKRLKAHVWAMHTQRSSAKSFKCSLCAASFTWQTSIYKHMKMMHSNKRTKTTRAPPPMKQESYEIQFYTQTLPIQQNIV